MDDVMTQVNNAELALCQALAEAHAEMPMPPLDSINPHFRSRYADLASIKRTYQPVLAKHGLFIEHLTGRPERDEDGKYWMPLTTRVVHAKTGAAHEATGRWPLAGNDPQKMGSALTYAKRYQVCALLDIVADEDDDANAASAPPKARKSTPKPKPDTPVDIDSVKAYQTTIEGLRHEAEQAGTLDALASIFKRGQELIKSGIKEDVCTVEDLERWVTLKEERKEKLSNPHNLNVEGDVP